MARLVTALAEPDTTPQPPIERVRDTLKIDDWHTRRLHVKTGGAGGPGSGVGGAGHAVRSTPDATGLLHVSSPAATASVS